MEVGRRDLCAVNLRIQDVQRAYQAFNRPLRCYSQVRALDLRRLMLSVPLRCAVTHPYLHQGKAKDRPQASMIRHAFVIQQLRKWSGTTLKDYFLHIGALISLLHLQNTRAGKRRSCP
jgi:hypothetical protein